MPLDIGNIPAFATLTPSSTFEVGVVEHVHAGRLARASSRKVPVNVVPSSASA